MGFFAKPKHCVFSAISGTITLNGEPVKHARLVRTGKLGHAKTGVVDETTTDENGYFSLPNMFQSASEFGGLAMFIIFQKIEISHNNQIALIWSGSKYDGEIGSENRGNTLDVICELSMEMRSLFINSGQYHTNCLWDVEKDPVEDWSDKLFD